MKVTLLDTVTMETKGVSGIETFQWAENNYSCDCNRELEFGRPDDYEQHIDSPYCLGEKRYLVIAAEIEGEDDYPATLEELNSSYSPELLQKHGIAAQ